MSSPASPHQDSDVRPQKTRLRYRARCPDCDFSRTKRDRGDAYSLQASGCPNCDRGLGVSKVRPASTWYDDEDEDGDDSPEYDECGSTDTFDGEPCEQPAGLGTEHDDGPCHYHRDDDGDEPEVRTDGGREPKIVDDRPPVCPNDGTLLEPYNESGVECPECGYSRTVVDRRTLVPCDGPCSGEVPASELEQADDGRALCKACRAGHRLVTDGGVNGLAHPDIPNILHDPDGFSQSFNPAVIECRDSDDEIERVCYAHVSEQESGSLRYVEWQGRRGRIPAWRWTQLVWLDTHINNDGKQVLRGHDRQYLPKQVYESDDVDRGDGPVTDGGRDHRSPAVLEALLKERKRENERLLELARDGMRLQAELPSIIAEVADACRETETRVYDCTECRTLWRAPDGLDACPECEYPGVSKRRVRDVTEGDE